MSLRVVLTAGAERDLAELHLHLLHSADAAVASRLLDRLESRCAGLADFPERGNIPTELEAVGIRDYRELHERPYRIIYRVLDATVVVHVIADGRRDFRDLLERRLLLG